MPNQPTKKPSKTFSNSEKVVYTAAHRSRGLVAPPETVTVIRWDEKTETYCVRDRKGRYRFLKEQFLHTLKTGEK